MANAHNFDSRAETVRKTTGWGCTWVRGVGKTTRKQVDGTYPWPVLAWRATLSTANLLSLHALLRPGKRPTALAARFGQTPRVVGGNPAPSARNLVQQGGKQLGSMACPMPQKHACSGRPLRALFQTAPLLYEPAVRSLQPLFIPAISKAQRQPCWFVQAPLGPCEPTRVHLSIPALLLQTSSAWETAARTGP